MKFAVVMFAAACALHIQALAAEPNDLVAGTIKRATGQVLLQRGPAQLVASIGLPVQTGDVIRTGRDGSASVTLRDDTMLSAGPDSELVVSQFRFDTTTHDGHLLLSIWRGVVWVMSGLIARKSPDAMGVQTRTVVLGVRGTEFIVDAGVPTP